MVINDPSGLHTVEDVVRELFGHPQNHIYVIPQGTGVLYKHASGYQSVPKALLGELVRSDVIRRGSVNVYKLRDTLPEWAEIIRVQAQLGT